MQLTRGGAVRSFISALRFSALLSEGTPEVELALV